MINNSKDSKKSCGGFIKLKDVFFVDKEFEAFLPDIDFEKKGYVVYVVDKQYLKELEDSKKRIKRRWGWEKK